ncbi:RICIN domain-containing protein [Streptomyces sp. NPDC001568]|uniref:RICIN domain-containing protein n=1 Tax=Streptomyces sp. NPDC001568 TaxID=3364588 RepID=UPI0036B11CE3
MQQVSCRTTCVPRRSHPAARRCAVQQGEWSGGTHQQWRPEPVGDGCYRLVTRHSGKVLQVTTVTAGTRNGALARQHLWANEDHQKFRLAPPSDRPAPSGSPDGDHAASALSPARAHTASPARAGETREDPALRGPHHVLRTADAIGSLTIRTAEQRSGRRGSRARNSEPRTESGVDLPTTRRCAGPLWPT